MFKSARRAIVLLLAGFACMPSVAQAQQRPATQRVLSRGASDAVRVQPYDAWRPDDRLLYGRIDRMAGSVLFVRSRTGRLIRTDATEAIRTDSYSAPLFVGKIVVIDGYYDAAKTLHARSVMRMGSLDAGTASDR